jgi:hypothetical protein
MSEQPPAGSHAPPQFANYPPPYPQGGLVSAAPPSGLAISALVLAIIPFPVGWMVACVLAIVVLVRAESMAEGGRGYAIAALVISSIWMVITFVVTAALVAVLAAQPGSVFTASHERSSDGTGDVDVYELREGDCVTSIPQKEVLDYLHVVRCSEPHRGEVYAVFDVDADESTPQDDIDQLSWDGCTRRFQPFVGTSYTVSRLEITYITPWKDEMSDYPAAVCLVENPGVKTMGSLKGVGR